MRVRILVQDYTRRIGNPAQQFLSCKGLNFGDNSMHRLSRSPITLSTTSESRYETLRYFKPLFYDITSHCPIYLRLEADTIVQDPDS